MLTSRYCHPAGACLKMKPVSSRSTAVVAPYATVRQRGKMLMIRSTVSATALSMGALCALQWLAMPGAAAQEAAETGVLEEITVTAQRRMESVRDVPISISVFSGEMIENNRIETLQDYLELTPNVSFESEGTPATFELGIRGVSNLGGASNVFGIYVDEFNVAPGVASTTFDQRLVDVERLEVLRGPQGTFFGRNVSGGAISITSRKPQPDFEANVLAEIANHDSYVLRGSINTPLTDRLFVRFGAYGESYGGFLKNDGPSNATNDREQYGGRVALRYQPTERLTADLSVSYSSLDQGFPNFVPSGTLNDTLAQIGFEPFPMAAGYYPENVDRIETDQRRLNEVDTLIGTGRVELSADGFSIVSISGFIDSDTTEQGE
ncbi:MAG: TonB-dependent receptor, partial [Steroidobacteraceae bacterium]